VLGYDPGYSLAPMWHRTMDILSSVQDIRCEFDHYGISEYDDRVYVLLQILSYHLPIFLVEVEAVFDYGVVQMLMTPGLVLTSQRVVLDEYVILVVGLIHKQLVIPP
jgi:hypothetical protein